MENKWNKKNALWQVLYMILYIVGSVVVCVCGSIHPIFFVGYQVTAGILLTGVLVKGFDQIQAPGVALSFAAGILLVFLAIGEFTAWHTLPVIIIGVLAEADGLIMGNGEWKTVVIAVGLSHGKRKISIAEIDVDFCDARTLYNMFLETMLNNTPENVRCNLRANPEHFVLKGVDEHTQEVIEISGGIPFPERFFIRYGDENGLVSKKESEYPFQAAGVAFLENGKIIGGVRHQLKDTEQGCHIKLMVEFPSVMPNANIRAHQYHLACEFYNWFSEFERRLANG